MTEEVEYEEVLRRCRRAKLSLMKEGDDRIIGCRRESIYLEAKTVGDLIPETIGRPAIGDLWTLMSR